MLSGDLLPHIRTLGETPNPPTRAEVKLISLISLDINTFQTVSPLAVPEGNASEPRVRVPSCRKPEVRVSRRAQMKFENYRPDSVRGSGSGWVRSGRVCVLQQFEAANAGGPWQLSVLCSRAVQQRERPSMGVVGTRAQHRGREQEQEQEQE